MAAAGVAAVTLGMGVGSAMAAETTHPSMLKFSPEMTKVITDHVSDGCTKAPVCMMVSTQDGENVGKGFTLHNAKTLDGEVGNVQHDGQWIMDPADKDSKAAFRKDATLKDKTKAFSFNKDVATNGIDDKYLDILKYVAQNYYMAPDAPTTPDKPTTPDTPAQPEVGEYSIVLNVDGTRTVIDNGLEVVYKGANQTADTLRNAKVEVFPKCEKLSKVMYKDNTPVAWNSPDANAMYIVARGMEGSKNDGHYMLSLEKSNADFGTIIQQNVGGDTKPETPGDNSGNGTATPGDKGETQTPKPSAQPSQTAKPATEGRVDTSSVKTPVQGDKLAATGSTVTVVAGVSVASVLAALAALGVRRKFNKA
ncbi:MAG: hypothetical protein U0L04_08545 [Bacteroidaceae bacterium]|nr:hypothetical protein [Bacteroidaceae bacterium]